MTLKITCPTGCESERKYVANILLKQFLGVEHKFVIDDGCKNIIISGEDTDKSLILDDSFFQSCTRHGWLSPYTMPDMPLEVWKIRTSQLETKLNNKSIPVIYGKNKVIVGENSIHIGIDIFGSSFFMLSRYEEVIIEDKDQHDRFPAKASLAFKENFLLRPIVNEYLEILWFYMKRLWPDLKRKERKFKLSVSCDVDFIWNRSANHFFYLSKQIAGDIIRRKSFALAKKTLKTFVKVKRDGLIADSFYSFDLIMDVCEEANTKVAFFFITAHSGTNFDGYYSIYSQKDKNLLKKINKRGHEIGLHPSYNTYLSYEQTATEILILKKVLKEERIGQVPVGGRQHFLRWKTPDTAVILDSLPLGYDSTLGYADHVGFRCGTCYEYPLYDVVKRKKLNIVEHPLIVMDCSGLSYMNLNRSDCTALYISLKEICKMYNGNFTFLWHNTSFTEVGYEEIFKKVIKA